MPERPEPKGVGGAFRESVRVLGVYIRAQLVIAAAVTVLYAIGFGFAGVPWWPAIAIIGGVTSVVPHIGPLVPLVLAAVADLLARRGMWLLLVAVGAWVAIQLFGMFFLTPRLLSRPLGLKPLPVFIALVAASLLFGPLGFLLAVPVLAIVNVFWGYFRRSLD
jgi:predicted PurR-regulated permease PerM